MSSPPVELIAAGVYDLCAGQVIEIVAFDGVHELARLARGRNHVVPAARRHLPVPETKPASRLAIGLDPWKS